jgi:hypothetical protein
MGTASVNCEVPYPGERLLQLLMWPDTEGFDLCALQESKVLWLLPGSCSLICLSLGD